MRILVWLTLGFAASSGVNAYRMMMCSSCISVALTLLLSFLFFLIGKDRKFYRTAAWFLFGCCTGHVWYQVYTANYISHASVLDGVTACVEIRTTDYSYETTYGRAVDGFLGLDGKSYSVRIYLDTGEELAPGTLLEGEFRFRLTTPDSMDGTTYHSGKGIFLLAYQEDEITTVPDGDPDFLAESSVLRRWLRDNLKNSLPEDVYPFSIALLLGDTSELSYETDTALKLSGIRHVAAVSGLHVSILFALMMQITFRKRILSSVVALPVLLLFAAIAGFTPSVNRACIMCALMVLALLFNREYDGLTALAFSSLVMLVYNPLTITNVSFQLSCASVAGIFLFSEPISGWLKNRLGNTKGKTYGARLKRWLAASVSTSLGATIFTTPLCAAYFGTVSLISVVTNLLTLWIISAIFYGLMAVCAIHLLYPCMAGILGRILAVPIRFLLYTAGLLAEIPFACVYTASPYIVAWLVFLYAVLFLFLLPEKKEFVTAMTCGILGLLAALLLSWIEPMVHDTSITVIDVGQGQCILLQSGGKSYLVDCGGDQDSTAADAAAQYLFSRGIARLDGVVVTHADRDHMGALPNLLTRIETSLLILPPVCSDFLEYDGNVIYADREIAITWGDSKLRIFGEKYLESDNENSLCVLLDAEKCDILITGDRDAAGEKRLVQAMGSHDVDVLIAGHHGSGEATSDILLNAVKPEIVCISVGEGNRYGHPAPETLKRLYQYGCRVYRTDLHGTISIRR